MTSFTSRTVISAFANIEETILAVHNTKLMFTQSQRRMTKDAMNAAELRAKELCGYLGYTTADKQDRDGFPPKWIHGEKQFHLGIAIRASGRHGKP
jgi:hypothetical protein